MGTRPSEPSTPPAVPRILGAILESLPSQPLAPQPQEGPEGAAPTFEDEDEVEEEPSGIDGGTGAPAVTNLGSGHHSLVFLRTLRERVAETSTVCLTLPDVTSLFPQCELMWFMSSAKLGARS